MTWEQKLQALQSLADTSLRMRKPGDWYVDARFRHIVGDGMQTAVCGNGRSPEAAVENDWMQVASGLPSDRRIRVKDGREFRWNGFMWAQEGGAEK